MSPTVPYPQPESRTPLAFSLAVLLHGMAAVALVVFLWNRPAPPPPPQTMTFEMVAGPGDAPTTGDNNKSTTTTTSSSMPDLTTTKSISPTPPADTVPPPPADVTPTPTTKENTSIVKPTPTTVVPKPQIKTPPIPKPQPKTPATTTHSTSTTPQVMTAQQFQQSHGITAASSSTAQSTSPRRGAVTAPGVHVGPISTSGTAAGNSSGGRG
ncbi:MAG TPA: hypothetical protein VK737_10010, partial [Opitutales bacterium]|nr:hypothetical protein [Opitutales bacterium]